MYLCRAFVGLDNKLYKMHSTYIKTVDWLVIVVGNTLFVWIYSLCNDSGEYNASDVILCRDWKQ